MITYNTHYLNQFIAQNILKDRLATPMINKIKQTIQMNDAWLKVQDNYK